jgi:hypothetical protein
VGSRSRVKIPDVILVVGDSKCHVAADCNQSSCRGAGGSVDGRVINGNCCALEVVELLVAFDVVVPWFSTVGARLLTAGLVLLAPMLGWQIASLAVGNMVVAAVSLALVTLIMCVEELVTGTGSGLSSLELEFVFVYVCLGFLDVNGGPVLDDSLDGVVFGW